MDTTDRPAPDTETVEVPAPTDETAAVPEELADLFSTVLNEEDLGTRMRALHALAALSGEASESALADIANDPSLPVRVRREAMLLLANKPGEIAFETFLDLLGSPEVDLRLAAAQGLGMLGRSDALGTLSDAFYAETSAAVARAIVQSMSRIGTPEFVNALIDYSSSNALPPGMSRDEILGALAGVENPEAVSTLTSSLAQATDAAERRAIVGALSQIADPASFDLFLSVAQQDLDLDTRCHAMQGLGLIGDERALPTLQSLSNSQDAKERSYAETAIDRIQNGH